MTPPVAIAVVSFNTRELLGRCLRSLAPEVEAGRAAVWVHDNASSDGSAELVRDRFGWASLIGSRENLGFGPAVNEVAARTDSPWLAPSNADVELRPGALEALLDAGHRDPSCGLLAPRLVTDDGSTQHSVHPFPGLRVSAALALGLPRLSASAGDRLGLQGYWDPSGPRRVDWAHGAFLLARREAFDAAGGFDPEQWMYAEDLDLAWRMRQLGWTTRYEPRAVARHSVAAATAGAFGADRDARHMRAAYRWMVRRRGWRATLGYAAVNVAGSAGKRLLLAPLAARAPDRFGVRRWRAARDTRLHLRGLRGLLGADDAVPPTDSAGAPAFPVAGHFRRDRHGESAPGRRVEPDS